MALTLADSPVLPASCGVAYKEWAGVCRALGDGRQTILLRKGGIDEAGGVFRPENPAFWLYPTHRHEAQQGLRDAGLSITESPQATSLGLDLLAVVESVAWVDRLVDAERLADLHVWTEETVRKRFEYRSPGLWVLGVRIYRRAEPWSLTILPSHEGCRTWVPLDPAPTADRLSPVLTDELALARRSTLDQLTGVK